MKAMFTGLLKGRIIRWSLLAAGAGLIVLLGTAASDEGKGQYKLGGAWVGPGWTGLHVPLDPAGRTAALRVNFYSYGGSWASLLAAFGADTTSDFVSQAEMISHDTAKTAGIGYGVKQGNPSAVCLIFVMRGTLTYTGPDNLAINAIFDVYPGPANTLGLPNADADGDGLPDPGVTPWASIPATSSAKRAAIP